MFRSFRMNKSLQSVVAAAVTANAAAAPEQKNKFFLV